MENRVLRCSNCGHKQEDSLNSSLVSCNACGREYLAADGIFLSQKTQIELDNLKKLRIRLDELVNINDYQMILSHAQDILKILPDDFVGQYFYAYAAYNLHQPKLLYAFYELHEIDDSGFNIERITNHMVRYADIKDYDRIVNFIIKFNETYITEAKSILKNRFQLEDNYAIVPRDVFISFRSTELDVVKKVVDALEKDGRKCWYSDRNLRKDDNENYWKNIEDAIDQSSIFLLISSQSAMLSPQVQRELQYANKTNKSKLEYKTDDSVHSTLFKHSFDGVKWIDASKENQFEQLRNRVFLLLQNVSSSNSNHKKLVISLKIAHDLRQKNKFADALEAYNDFLDEFPNSIEANWGALLSEYGIEYITEDGETIPTLHRPIQNYKITEDKYAKAILKLTRNEEQQQFLEKITELERLRQQIEELSKQDKEYDIFISCKITKPNEKIETKTEDYEWGLYIYRQFTQRGLNVFFSPISLASSNGSYEPIIYSALQSSKYLIILSSQSEYLVSTWIKNEWERFISIRNKEKSKKYVKLVIENEVATYVPAKLKQEGQFIEHDQHLKWFTLLENAVLEIFPEYRNIQYNTFNNSIKSVNLNFIKKYKNQKIKSYQKITYQSNETKLNNPYEVSFRTFQDNQIIDRNLEECKRKVEIYLRNQQFREASIEMKAYLRFAGNESHYQIELLKLFIETQSTDLNDFFNDKIQNLNSIESISNVIYSLDHNHYEAFIEPLIQFIEIDIKDGKKEIVADIYRLIADYETPKIKDLHINVARSLGFLIDKPKLMMKYHNILLPYIANIDLEQYVHIFSDFADSLCKQELFEEAKQIISNIILVDQHNVKAKILQLMIQFEASDYKKLFTMIEDKQAYVQIENLVESLYISGVESLSILIRKHVIGLIDNFDFNKAYPWLEIIAKIDFDDRKNFFMKIIETCLKTSNSFRVFDVALHTLEEDNFDFFMKTAIQFIKTSLQHNNYNYAKQLAEEISHYDHSNLEVLNLLLASELKTPSLLSQNIDITNLKDFTIVEQLLMLYPNDEDKEDLLNKLLGLCVLHIMNNDVSEHDYLFELFDKLLTYFPNITKNRKVKDQIQYFANHCLSKRMFERAQWYFITIIRLDAKYHKAYWGVLKSKLGCVEDSELEKHDASIDKIPEYTFAIVNAEGDRDAENHYAQILQKQRDYIKKNKSNYQFLMLITLAVILAVISVALIGGS